MAAPSGFSTTLTPSLEPHFTFVPGLKHEHRWHHRGFSGVVHSRLYHDLATKHLFSTTRLRIAA